MTKITWQLSFFVALFVSAFCAFADDSLKFPLKERPKQDILRDIGSKGEQVIQLAKIQPGMQVLDLLGGGGYYSELLNNQVGKTGKVYLHNNQAYVGFVNKQLKARLAKKRLNNVVDHRAELDNLNLAPNSLDAVFFILGYHDMYHQADGWKIDKDKLLKQITTVLKKGGKFIVVDHSAEDGTGIEHAQHLHRIDKDYVSKEVMSLGFSLLIDSPLLTNNQDDRHQTPFIPNLRRKTDRFVLVFSKN